mmetsp:Transcript_12203/g.22522  ORF Transcript_12203/g.22522 Transcript_12203/m.22522 type:complete len:216 (-) Transcript_12203:463-1110(-)
MTGHPPPSFSVSSAVSSSRAALGMSGAGLGAIPQEEAGLGARPALLLREQEDVGRARVRFASASGRRALVPRGGGLSMMLAAASPGTDGAAPRTDSRPDRDSPLPVPNPARSCTVTTSGPSPEGRYSMSKLQRPLLVGGVAFGWGFVPLATLRPDAELARLPLRPSSLRPPQGVDGLIGTSCPAPSARTLGGAAMLVLPPGVVGLWRGGVVAHDI